MATQKQQKTELIAIYRLEFYKKQKNWKLSTDTRREKELRNSHPTAPVKNNNILNKTYSVETGTDNNGTVLNDAFLNDESDKDVPESPTAQTMLSTQWLAPINACQECVHTDAKPQNPWADYVSDGLLDHDVNKCRGDGNEVEGYEGWAEGMVWTNSDIPQPGWPGDVPALMNMQDVECPGQVAWAADTILYHQLDQLGQMTPWPDDQMWVPHIWEENELLVASLESVDEFMIGAHSAPHSSEVELCVPTEQDGVLDTSEGSLCRMSGAELSAAVRRHTGSLRRLLREAGSRRKHRSTVSLDLRAPDHFGLASRDFFSTDYSYDAFPTRDVPATPLSPITLCKDTFTPIPPPNQSKGTLTPLSSNQCKDSFTPQSSALKSKYAFTPSSQTIQNKDGFIANPSYQSRNTFTPPPANLYTDGFLAGSYRNKVPLGFVGRGRGRLQGDAGLHA